MDKSFLHLFKVCLFQISLSIYISHNVANFGGKKSICAILHFIYPCYACTETESKILACVIFIYELGLFPNVEDSTVHIWQILLMLFDLVIICKHYGKNPFL